MIPTRYACVLATAAALAGCAALTACSSHPSAAQRSLPSLAPLNLPTQTSAAPTQSATAAPVAALPDACSLLTRAEAQTVAGVKLRAGDDTKARNPQTDTASCTYDAPVTGSSGEVAIFVQQGVPNALKVDRTIGHKFHSVPGIGDEATEEQNNIFFRRGNIWIFVNSAYGATPAHLEAAARTVAGRLTHPAA